MTYIIELESDALHYFGQGVYGWGPISSTTGESGRVVEFLMQAEALEWMQARNVFCSGAVVAKRGRGRPTTGTALTPAQKQKAYRERLKGNVTVNSITAIDEKKQLREQLIAAIKRAELAEAERDVMGNELAKIKAKVNRGNLKN